MEHLFNVCGNCRCITFDGRDFVCADPAKEEREVVFLGTRRACYAPEQPEQGQHEPTDAITTWPHHTTEHHNLTLH